METASEISITREEREAMDRKYRREMALNYAMNISPPDAKKTSKEVLHNAEAFFEFLNK